MKNVQISQELFIRLVRLLVFEFDEDTDLIKKELEDKNIFIGSKGLNKLIQEQKKALIAKAQEAKYEEAK